jgi:membrane-associated phospholipid phosphatase
MILTLGMVAVALITTISTGLRFTTLPSLMPVIAGVFILDVLSRLAAQTRLVRAIQILLYGVLYLVITCFCGVLAAYSAQRIAFPLQDHLFAGADHALGMNWFDIVHWVDDRPAVHAVLKFAYHTMSAQIVLPVVVLALADRTDDLKKYLLGFAIALTVTIIVSALVPAASPIALVDRSTFHVLRFTGATPLDHLMHLRAAEPTMIGGGLAGIITFPSFHATVAILTPLTLWRYRGLFFALLLLNAAMLASTVTEGAHYVSDVPAGCAVAIIAFLLAKRLAAAKDGSSILVSAVSAATSGADTDGRRISRPALDLS